MNNFETVIGIEIHIELNTKTKMFSSAPNNFHAEPNTNVSVVDLAYPGTMPVLNKEAVVKAIKLAKALKMDIDDVLHFDRKNYMYPDLPKGFQITQNERPIGSDGILPIKIDNKIHEIALERIHLEEDTAKSTHKDDYTYLDFNRAGVPLIEIVTHPVMRNAKEAAAYIEMIRDLVKSLEISDARMEEGSLRADINISLRPYGQQEFGTKVEIKNLNSLGNVEKAIEREIAHQSKALLKGKVIQQATKRFDEIAQDTVTMRVKTEAADYRYHAEPNIPPIKLEQEFIDSISIGELPWETITRLEKSHIESTYIDQLISDRSKLFLFDSIQYEDRNKLAKFFFAEIVSLANNEKASVYELSLDPHEITNLLVSQDKGIISGSHVKKILPHLVQQEMTVEQTIEKFNFKQISDKNTLGEMIDKIIVDNKDFVDSNKDRPERVGKFVLGLVMKESRGQANPVVASQIVEEKIGA